MVLYWLLAIDISIFSMRISAFFLVCFQVLVEFWLYLQLGRTKHAHMATENTRTKHRFCKAHFRRCVFDDEWKRTSMHQGPKNPGGWMIQWMFIVTDVFSLFDVSSTPRLGLSFLIIAFATSLSALNHEIPEVTGQSTRWTRSVVVCYGFLDLAWYDAYDLYSFAWNNKNSLQSIQQTASKETTNACSQALIRRLWLCWKCYSVPSAIRACLFSLSSSIDLARLGSYLAAHIRSLSIYPAEKFAELEATLTLGDFTVLRSNCVNCRRPQVGSLWWYAFSFCWLQCFYCSLVRKHMASLQS